MELKPGEERIPTGVLETAILYRMLKEVREMRSSMEKSLARIAELLTARGEIVPLKVRVGDGWVKIMPGRGLWRCVNIYNCGEKQCFVKLNRLDSPEAVVEPNGSRSWSFITECIESIYARGGTVLEVEFLR
jgi:hypothetical protein